MSTAIYTVYGHTGTTTPSFVNNFEGKLVPSINPYISTDVPLGKESRRVHSSFWITNSSSGNGKGKLLHRLAFEAGDPPTPPTTNTQTRTFRLSQYNLISGSSSFLTAEENRSKLDECLAGDDDQHTIDTAQKLEEDFYSNGRVVPDLKQEEFKEMQLITGFQLSKAGEANGDELLLMQKNEHASERTTLIHKFKDIKFC